MRKIICAAVAAIPFIASTSMVAAAPVATPLTQPAAETVSGDSDLIGMPLAFLVAAVVAGGVAIGVVASQNGGPTSP